MRRRADGFTLIEIIVTLAVLAVLLGLLAPMGFQLLTSERETAVEEELDTIYKAIVGDPKRGGFGFVGDVGGYPTSLLDLVVHPKDTSGTPLPGWKGPYLQNPRIEGGVLVDPFGRPYEYFLVTSSGGSDQFALIGRGLDGLSTNNTTGNPNDHSAYVGPAPTDSSYAGGANNPDNAVFPLPDGNPNALNAEIQGGVAINVLNFDANPEVDAFVPACPALFTITATSVARETVEANLPYVAGLEFGVTQGQYRVVITPQDLVTTAWTETVTALPAATVTRDLNLTGLDSSGTPLFNLTVVNGFTNTELEVFEFNDKLKSTDNKSRVKPGETKVFTPHGCGQMYIRIKGKSTVVDQFVMPYGATTQQEGTQAACLIVDNLHHHGDDFDHPHHHNHHHHHHHGHHKVLIFVNNILFRSVKHHKTKTFCDLRAGDAVQITDKDGFILTTLTLAVGSNSVTIQ